MTKDELRTRIEAELLCGITPKDLSAKYDVPYVSIVGWKKRLLMEKETESVSDLTQHTKATLEVIRDVAKVEAPRAAAKIDTIIDGIQGLKELEPEFHAVLHRSVEIAHEFLGSVDDEGKTLLSIKEWELITKTLASAYGTLFNKSGNVVNVAQTNISAASENLGFFKASQRSV